MTTGRINQVTAFHCATTGGGRGPSPNAHRRGAQRVARALHVPGGLRLSQHTGAGLRTASHGAIHSPFAIPSSTHSPLHGRAVCEGTDPVTAATSSSLGRLAGPNVHTGCSQLFSHHSSGEHWCNTPCYHASRISPARRARRDMSRSIRAAMGQAQSAPVVSLGQRLAEPPARCLPGSQPSSCYYATTAGESVYPVPLDGLRGIYHLALSHCSPL